MRKSMSKRLIAIVVLTTIATGSTATIASANVIKKDESVYVTLNTKGDETSKVVTNWIHSDDKNITVKDKSSLTDIKNVKGLEKPEQTGDDIKWKMNDNDLYYQGKTDKQLPVGVDIKYYLNGKEKNADEIAGKSGNVTIKIKFTNKISENKMIGDKERTIYLPIAIAGELSLPLDTYSNVRVNGGKVISEGKDNIVTFAAMPGIKETLNVEDFDKKLAYDLNDEIEISASCTKFEIGSMMMVATTMMPEIDTLEATNTIDELKDSLKKLKDGSDKLLDGTNKLKEGTDSAVLKLNDAKSMMNDPKIQEKLNLIMIDNNVSRANTLIRDAMYAKDLDTSQIKEIMNLVNQGNYEKASVLIQDAKDLIQYKDMVTNSVDTLKDAFNNKNVNKLIQDLEVAKLSYDNVSPETKEKIKALGDIATKDNIEKAQQILKNTISDTKVVKGQAEELLSHKDELVNGFDTFKDSSEDLMNNANDVFNNADEFMKQANGTLSGVNTLMSEVEVLKPDITKVIGDAKSLDNNAQGLIKQIMDTTGTKTPDEALKVIDGMIAKLNGSMSTIDNIMDKVSEFYGNEDNLKMMMSDVSDYGKSYLILKGYIAYEVQVECAKGLPKDQAFAVALKNVQEIVDNVYSSNPQLVSQLNELINKLSKNPSLFAPEGMANDAIKINSYKTQIDGLIKEIDNNKENVMGLKEELQSVKALLPVIESSKPILMQAKALLEESKTLYGKVQPLMEQGKPLLSNAQSFVNKSNQVLEESKGLLNKSQGVMNQAAQLEGSINGLVNSDDAKGVVNYIGKLQQMESSAEGTFIKNLANTFVNISDDELNKLDSVKVSGLALLQDVDGAKDSINDVMNLVQNIKSSGKDKEIASKVTKLEYDINNSKELLNQVEGLAGSIDSSKMNEVSSMAYNLLNMQQDLKNCNDILLITQDALSKGNIAQARSLVNGLPTLESGIKQLTDGITALNDGMTEFATEGIDKLNETGNEAVDDAVDTIAAKDEMVELSKKYDTFTGKGENMESAVKFIIKTEEIKAPEEKVANVNVKTNTEKKSFWNWLKSLFS